ncbi:uncharacterized protein LOC113375733 [Ctenocephalides felis]|uniref:uncharacterized protein LOC113375733 n=1 Tax=Ctenocephalides felis TaxID=7515 RepID=UPI000E6E3236|nr:uncharacterized protein LOC113375733 [Ctenocephalides felis]
MNRNNYMVCLFSDIKGAYDNVVPGILYDTLDKIGLPKKFVRAITTTVFERDVYYKINNQMIGPRKMYKGLPQGGILSPILYALYVRDIEHIWEQGTKILQYADDVLIYIEKTSLQDAIDTMSRNIENFDKWLVSKGLELSSEKSSIEHIEKKVEKNINILRMLNGTWWGSHPISALKLYKTLFRPIFDYGCLVWNNSKTCKKLDKLQYRCLRICMGAMLSTPTNALLVESREMPLELRRQFLCDKFVLKNLSIENSRFIENVCEVAVDTRLNNQSCISKLRNLTKSTTLQEVIYYEILKYIQQILCKGGDVKIIWVKAHSGMAGNEIADRIAKQAADNGEVINEVTLIDYINASKNNCMQLWQNEWDNTSSTIGNYYKNINPSVGNKIWQRLYKDERRHVLVELTRLRFNHGNFPAHMYRLKLAPSNICVCGEAVGTSQHLILECII